MLRETDGESNTGKVSFVNRSTEQGRTYRCPVCGAEVTVMVRHHGDFMPRCCNRAMIALKHRPAFMVCPVCGTQISVWNAFGGKFVARCCNMPMRRVAA